MAALRRAAQRMRGPLERDVLAVERILEEGCLEGEAAASTCAQLHRELVHKWRGLGYESEPPQRERPRDPMSGIDCVTQRDESYGRDVGCEVPLCLLRPVEADDAVAFPATLSAKCCHAAADALQAHGFVLLKAMLAKEEV